MKSTLLFLVGLLLVQQRPVVGEDDDNNTNSSNFNGTRNDIDWSEMEEGLLVGPGVGIIHETDFCNVVRDSSLHLKDALRGRELSIIVQYGEGFDFFQYDPQEELSNTNPSGMIASLLDQLANRAGFSWRNTFVAYNTTTVDILHGSGKGKWDRMLRWATSNFDLAVDKWFLTTERLESETVFLNSWFDATLILVDEGDEVELNWLGFAAPFDAYVWYAILGTIAFSAFFMMMIEYLENKRDGRSFPTWFGDHLYLSNMAFSQNFAYDNPISGAGRIFLSSFAFWAMLIGATYTANLASLLVENALSSPVHSIRGAMQADLSICVHDGSASETIVRTLHPEIQSYDKVVKCSTPAEMYTKLNNDQCDLLLGTRQEFEIYKIQKQYGCGLVQAGNELHQGSASFAIQFDPLNCDSVLAYVMNIHLHAMSVDGNITKLWDSYIDAIDGRCEDANVDEYYDRRRRLQTMKDKEKEDIERNTSSPPPSSSSNNRMLKGKGGGGGGDAGEAAGMTGSNVDELLKIKGMAGVFLFHLCGTSLALLVAIYSQFRRRYIKPKKKMVMANKSLSSSSAAATAATAGYQDSNMQKYNKQPQTELERRYEALKQDFMIQLDDLFEVTKMKKQYSENTLGMENAFETSSEDDISSCMPITARSRRIDMDGSVSYAHPPITHGGRPASRRSSDSSGLRSL
eukprot:scaffold609_cov130-Cylindrotheca_fusiformis.AAC.16